MNEILLALIALPLLLLVGILTNPLSLILTLMLLLRTLLRTTWFRVLVRAMVLTIRNWRRIAVRRLS